VELTFPINGTDTNPYAKWGLRWNPFPGVPYHELQRGAMQLNSLGGEPIRSADDIRERLRGFEPAFVERVIRAWRPGKLVHIHLTFPRARN
jgi:hypothetical protein